MKRKLPISNYQQLFFLEWTIDPEKNLYNVSSVYKFVGDLDKTAFKSALEYYFSLHEILHATYNNDGSACYYNDYSIDQVYYIESLDTDINAQIRKILDTPFDFVNGPLCKFYLLPNPNVDNEYYFII